MKKLLFLARKLYLNSRYFSLALAAAVIFTPVATGAVSLDELRSQLGGKNQEVEQLRAQAEQVGHEAENLEQQLAAMSAEMDALRSRIVATQAQINDVNAQIAEIEARIADKKAVLAQYVKSDYYVSNASTLEILVGSESLSDFVDNQQYLRSSQTRIQGIIKEIAKDKVKLDAQKIELDKLNSELTTQKAGLDAQIAAKNDLLAKTRGEQAKYEELLAKAQESRDRINNQIASMMSSGNVKSQGYVVQGQVIGRQGNTGFSTGSHLHFGAYMNRTPVSPYTYLNSGRFIWPMAGFTITQDYNNYWCNGVYVNCRHDGIDMDGGWGKPIQAAASGNIVMNTFDPYGFGHYIVVDHGGGQWSIYAHMQQ